MFLIYNVLLVPQHIFIIETPLFRFRKKHYIPNPYIINYFIKYNTLIIIRPNEFTNPKNNKVAKSVLNFFSISV